MLVVKKKRVLRNVALMYAKGQSEGSTMELILTINPHQKKNHLSGTEVKVLRSLAEGYTRKEKSQCLDLGIHTVNTEVERIYTKLACTT